MPDSSVHRRQFVASYSSDIAEKLPKHWLKTELSGLQVWHCPELPVQRLMTSDGIELLLLGLAYQAVAGAPQPETQIAQTSLTEMPEVTQNWCGRFALLTAEMALGDASVSLPLLTGHDGTVIGSSLALLSKSPPITDELIYEIGMDFVLLPATAGLDVFRTSPRFALCIENGRWIPRKVAQLCPEATRDYEDVLSDLGGTLLASVRSVADSIDEEILLPLTAGYDSRLLLAAAVKLDLNFSTYTMDNGVTSDLDLARQLSEIAGVSHQIIPATETDPDLIKKWDLHSHGERPQADRFLYARGQWAPLSGRLILGGGYFEVGRCVYYSSLPDMDAPGGDDIYDSIHRHLFYPLLRRKQKRNLASLKTWTQSIDPKEMSEIDYRELFFIDQRMAGWMGDLEQSIDLTGATRIHVANCQRTYELMLSVPLDVRMKSAHHRDLIRLWAPELDALPFNPSENTRPRLSKTLRRLRKLRKYVHAIVT